nr:hypothetical protein [Tanacetum cinerariifolium]
IRCYNCKGDGHYASNCTVKQRKRDVDYLQTQLQIAQKDEAGIQLNYEEFDFMAAAGAYDEIEKVTARCHLEDNLQQESTSSTQSDKASVYDSDGSAEAFTHLSNLHSEASDTLAVLYKFACKLASVAKFTCLKGCQILGGKLVCQSAKKQGSGDMSSAEDEYVVAAGYLSLIMEHMLRDQYKNDKLLTLKPYKITAAILKPSVEGEAPLTAHMCNVAGIIPQRLQTLNPSSERVNADESANKSLSETFVQQVSKVDMMDTKSSLQATHSQATKEFVAPADSTKSLDASESAEVQVNQPKDAATTKFMEVLDQNVVEETEKADADSLIIPTMKDLLNELNKRTKLTWNYLTLNTARCLMTPSDLLGLNFLPATMMLMTLTLSINLMLIMKTMFAKNNSNLQSLHDHLDYVCENVTMLHNKVANLEDSVTSRVSKDIQSSVPAMITTALKEQMSGLLSMALQEWDKLTKLDATSKALKLKLKGSNLQPLRDPTKAKGVATDDSTLQITQLLEEGRSAQKSVDIKEFSSLATVKAQELKWKEHEEKKAKILNDYNDIFFRDDPLPITKISYTIDTHKIPTMRITRDHDSLNLTVLDNFRLKIMKAKFQWVLNQAKKVGQPPPPELATFRMTTEQRKRKRISGKIGHVIREPKARLITRDSQEARDLINLMEYEIASRNNVTKAREIAEKNLDGLGNNVGDEVQLSAKHQLTMKGLFECKASESNIRRIQVKDTVKELEDYLKAYSSAGMDNN